MKFFIAAFLACVCAALAADQLVLDSDIIRAVNSNPKATWVAGENAVFKGKTLSQIRHMFGVFLVDKENTIQKYSSGNVTMNLPDNFDSQTNWPQCKTINDIRNQGQCGSCWAFSATEAMADRFCIASSGSINKQLSPQDMVSCDKGDYACQGGYLQKLWQYYEQTGTVTDNCFPYKSFYGTVPPCPTSCVPGSTDQWHKYKAKAGSTKNFESVEDAQNDIATHGPIQAGFKVYQDFFTYKKGVYRHLTGGFAGGHAVKVVGWGVDSATQQKYWVVNNSWGNTWGMNGVFWIQRGNNECDFESNLWVADPLL
jgi:cathepsin B